MKFKIKNKREPVIAILGLTFKPNIDDLRQSPALDIALNLNKNKETKCLYVEPNITKHDFLRITKLEEAVKKSDIIAILVGHKQFKNIENLGKKKVLDFCGIKH